jgi:hypothetical protein
MEKSQQSYNPGRSKNDYKYLVDWTTQVTIEFPPDKLVPLNSSIPFNTDLHPISTLSDYSHPLERKCQRLSNMGAIQMHS